jgi:hypothetical protein
MPTLSNTLISLPQAATERAQRVRRHARLGQEAFLNMLHPTPTGGDECS